MTPSRFAPGLALLALSAASARAETFWSGAAGGYKVVWDSSDLMAASQQDGHVVFSAQAQLQKRSHDAAGKHGEGLAPATAQSECRATETIRLLAVVGPYLGYREQSETSCPGWAHPAGEVRFRTIDLRRSAAATPAAQAQITLTDLFAADTISQALRRDGVIAQADEGVLPENLPDLITELSVNATPPRGQCFRFPRDALSRFALAGYVSGHAQVRIGLPGAGPCRMALTQLGLELRPPAALTGMLLAAQSGKAGVLGPASGKPGAETALSLSFSSD